MGMGEGSYPFFCCDGSMPLRSKSYTLLFRISHIHTSKLHRFCALSSAPTKTRLGF